MSSGEKPRIIVDDDWKTRVQAEKETLQQQPAGGAHSKPEEGVSEIEGDEELPPASFETLVSMFVTQALAAMGQIPMGEDQQPVLLLDHAKFNIDLLAVLQEKTKGNLSANETALLENLLHELRMVFVQVGKQAKRSGQ